METLIVNNATKEDLELLLDIAKKLGIDLKIVPKKKASSTQKKSTLSKEEEEKMIMELSKKVNRAVHEKYVKPVLDDCYNRQ